jgi:predicted transcriptional regulator
MADEKAMTVRLSQEQAEALETVATVEDLPVSRVIRAAIAEHIERVRQNPAFQDSLRGRIDRAQKLLKRSR